MGLGGTSDTAPLDVAGFEVGWRDAKGEHRRPLSEAEEVEFETELPVRGFPSCRGRRNARRIGFGEAPTLGQALAWGKLHRTARR